MPCRTTSPRTSEGRAPKRHAHAHFVRPARDDVRHDAVEPDRGQRQREAGERREQHDAEPLPRERVGHDRVERLDVVRHLQRAIRTGAKGSGKAISSSSRRRRYCQTRAGNRQKSG